jgi:uncharacterized protein (DUF2252 family)
MSPRAVGARPAKAASVEERAALGKGTRRDVPLDAQAEPPASSDRDPVALLAAQDAVRVPELVPIRYGRMAVSSFSFYRGAARVMAADLSSCPTSGLRTQLCGDAHLSNFGAYASAERRLVFDINDFDETCRGPFEWDIKRLAASFVVAGRENGFSDKRCRALARGAASHYRRAVRAFAQRSILDVWYLHLDIETAAKQYVASLSKRQRKQARTELGSAASAFAKARTRTSLQAIRKLTVRTPAGRRIVSDPPLVIPIDEMTGIDADAVRQSLRALLAGYRGTMQSDRRHLIDHFTLSDIAHKVVGVGSVGLRAWILLLEAGVESEGLLLQAKQAMPSVLAEFVGGPRRGGQGARVVAGQRLMQASSDIFLGWLTIDVPSGGREDYYLRQLRDWKLSADIEVMTPASMDVYARMCGWTLARAHARGGDRIAIAAYLGKSTRFDDAIADFAMTYADQNGRDHRALITAIGSGRVRAETGV